MPLSRLPAPPQSADTGCARLVRRRLRVHDLHRVDVLVDEAGDFTLPGRSDGSVHVLQLPPAGQPDVSDVEVLDAIGDLVVQLADDTRVVVLGPASALTDAPASAEGDLARDAILRDRTACAPPSACQRPARPLAPQALALYALGPAHPGVPVGERWTVVADVSDSSSDPGVIDDLVTDVVAAMASEPGGPATRVPVRPARPTATLLPRPKALDRQAHQGARRCRRRPTSWPRSATELARISGPHPVDSPCRRRRTSGRRAQ